MTSAARSNSDQDDQQLPAPPAQPSWQRGAQPISPARGEEPGPRERLAAAGPQALEDAELLALCLGSGSRQCDVLTLARRLLDRFGGICGVLDADLETLKREPGLGPAKASMLKAAIALADRYLLQELERLETLSDPLSCARFLELRLGHRDQEVFAAVFLDTRHRVIAFEELFAGTINGASVYPREVVRACLRHNAAALILAHNHPSGVAEPSAADIAVTKRLKSALLLIDVQVLDHLVVGNLQTISLANRGML